MTSKITYCRGFGERRGNCKNPPGQRTASGVTVSSLCATCEEAWQANARPPQRGRITGIEYASADSGIRRRVRRVGG